MPTLVAAHRSSSHRPHCYRLAAQRIRVAPSPPARAGRDPKSNPVVDKVLGAMGNGLRRLSPWALPAPATHLRVVFILQLFICLLVTLRRCVGGSMLSWQRCSSVSLINV
jgi:hypothetical protein